MPKWAKTIVAIALLPFCFGAAKALWRVLRATGKADTFWVALLAGAACWMVIFLLLPRPTRLYVLGHELTHAVWTWLFGGRVKRFKVGAGGGHVVITKSNFLIALAPYFFPFYVVLLVLVFGLGHLIWDWTRYRVWFHLLVGVAYGFHLTLTWQVLQTRQSDMTQHGYFFSATIIFLGNVTVLLVGLPLLSNAAGPLTALGWWLESTGEILRRLGSLF